MIVLALSGGIDSAVAGRLLLDEGHSVRGLYMKHRYQADSEETDAGRVADFLGISLEVLDLSDFFERIIENFTDEYFSGRTPNPCVLCNRLVKFGLIYEHVFSRSDSSGLATGHYVRRREMPDGEQVLLRGLDDAKDQSYVLYGIEKDRLSRLYFPLGEMNKNEVKQIADRCGFPNREKKESQDICFVADGCHSEFLHARRPGHDTSGRFVSPEGQVLAVHTGFEQFTIGQRKGMGVGFGKRVFVLKLDAETNDVTIGSWEQLARRKVQLEDLRWLLREEPSDRFRCEVKIRYRCEASSAFVTPVGEGRAEVEFDTDRHGVAPGQSAVFYDGDRVLGGGIICSAE